MTLYKNDTKKIVHLRGAFFNIIIIRGMARRVGTSLERRINTRVLGWDSAVK